MSFTQTYTSHDEPQNASSNNARCVEDKSKGSKELKRKNDLSKENAAIKFDGPSSDGQSGADPIETEEGFKDQRSKAIGMIRNVRSKPFNYFKHYFGVENTTEMNNVKANYSRVESSLPNTGFQLDASKPSDVYAYSYFGTPTVFLCNGYKSAKGNTRKDTQSGIILHEETHIDLDTEDYEYGEESIFANRVLTKEQAMNNAETYEYAAENVAGISG